MFRRPRETSNDEHEDVKPSVGRPPTPPSTPAKTPFALAIPPKVPPPKMAATKAKPSKASPLPTIGRQGLVGSTKKTPVKGIKDKGNGNIMAFFQKSEEAAGLFVQEKGVKTSQELDAENRRPSPIEDEDGLYEVERESRFNEDAGPVKRRKVSVEPANDAELFGAEIGHEEFGEEKGDAAEAAAELRKPGPFFEESDSEQEEEQPAAVIGIESASKESEMNDGLVAATEPDQEVVEMAQIQAKDEPPDKPTLIKEETSYDGTLADFKDFEGMDDFDEDQFEEGDEYMERRYMEEQARLEAEDGEKDYDPLPPDDDNVPDQLAEEAPSCPICSVSLKGISEQDSGVHVNNCLDGNPTPLPEPKKPPTAPPPAMKTENAPSPGANQFKKPGRLPKPGQANPFEFARTGTAPGSAFTQLMSGHSEEAAWKEAAAAEHKSRGKPAYQRTCPFYKILPGLFICVDAFRYGAVEGCKAYFLSHFHSDHYIGLTSTWNHGPIYCSKVTANLVRQQLRVDSKYVVPLEFEQTVELPNTKGVKVTMIPANHCPGSSLYLFEKAMGKKANGEMRLQRILHCGDFRACRAHIEHPLLMPNVQDTVSGKTKEQKIDVCYLDTTYLNPKYAFPSQENVIKACADMCVSLSKHTVDESDGWEQMKRQRAGEGMVKFVRKESNPSIKDEPADDEDNKDNMKLITNPAGSQQVFTTSTMRSARAGRGRLLVVVGTYSIGKERICLGIARALNSKIYAPPSKQRIVAALEDPELNSRMTSDPRAAQVHMTPLFEIRADTLDDYLKDYFPHFTRAVGFRPSGWNYRPPTSRFTDSPTVQTVLYSDNWKSAYSMKDLVPQRGSSSRASCFGVPYSEHSSFRELTMFCTALRIERVIPTVNVGSAKSRERMKGWCERWAVERKKNGLFELPQDGSW